jgi:hypothetical protein
MFFTDISVFEVKQFPVSKIWTLITSLHSAICDKRGDLSCCVAIVSNHAAVKYYILHSAPVCLFVTVSVHFRNVQCFAKPVSGAVDNPSLCSKPGRTAADPGGGADVPV